MTPIYRPLNSQEVRLVILHPGTEVKCDLIHVHLESLPFYETISYVWGNRKIRETILLNGQEKDVPASTKSALRRMQQDRERYLWIDAVCINQDDVDERSQQVALMASIYSQADNIVWLGEDVLGCAEPAVKCMQLILNDAIRQLGDVSRLKQTLFVHDALAWKIATMESAIDEQALLQFFSNPWFRRRWVVQEVALAKSSICLLGTVSIPLMDVLLSAAWIQYHYLTFAHLEYSQGLINAAVMLPLVDHELERARSFALPSLLKTLNEFRNEDPKDCVYALLALSQKFDGVPPRIVPDYSAPLRQIFTQAASTCIEQRQDLDILNDHRHNLDDKMPSWVPHYDRSEVNDSILIYDFKADAGMVKSGFTINDYILTTHGVPLGHIQKMADEIGGNLFDDPAKMSGALAGMRSVVESTLARPSAEVLGMTLCASRRFDGSIAKEDEITPTLERFEQELAQGRLPPWPADKVYDPMSPEGRQSEYLHEIFSVAPGRRLFATTDRIGLGPSTMRLGDTLVILQGCRWPVILRPQGDNYRLIGTTYVYGIMFGEAIDKDKDLAMEEFVLE